MMYVILTPINSNFGSLCVSNSNYVPPPPSLNYQAYFTVDIDSVAAAIKKPGNKVFRLDTLTEIKDIEVTYKEVTMETQND